MVGNVRPVPEGYHTVTPDLVVQGAAEAIEFYKTAFGAEERARMATPDGAFLVHAELQIGDSKVFLADQMPNIGQKSPQSLGGSPVTIHLQVEDADAVWGRAIAAGATETMPLMNAPWGDRYGQLVDPFGHRWSIGTHIEDVSPEEIERRMAAVFQGS
jgi:PhnB protein